MREEWDLPLLRAMSEHWRVHPPVHLLKALEMGYEAPAEAAEPGTSQSDLGGFMAAVAQMNGAR